MAAPTDTTRDIALSIVYFSLSTLITWYFIYCGDSLYHYDESKMFLSCAIAGAKWGIQILGALFFLKDKRWQFIRRIAFVCLTGSVVLLPYCLAAFREIIPGNPFLISLVAAVTVMIGMYFQSVRRTRISVKWFFFWLLCLATAVTLQLTVVFHVL